MKRLYQSSDVTILKKPAWSDSRPANHDIHHGSGRVIGSDYLIGEQRPKRRVGRSMVIHVHQGKGRRDRDVPLSPALLEELRGYWRWMKPKTFLFPGVIDGWRADVPLSDKTVWFACQSAARAAGIEKHSRRPTIWRSPRRYYAGDHWILRKQLNYDNPDVVAYVQAVRRR
jgi:integrase